ncbi:MAG TPA: Fur family transcriptional regulator [Bryobacteraceae bacterium]|jgi:Fur family ferric uptake transcriptional regulator|nr:Fur family transcriptional regulator [Bryobacteraceae bacterium]
MEIASQKRRSLVEEFTTKGLRLTGQRRALLEIIESANEHLDAASILRLAEERHAGINRATVYRTLELLKKLGLIDELDLMHLSGEKHYYEAKGERDHIHLACFHCGRIEEFGSALFERLKRQLEKERGFRISVVRMEAGGRCSNCSQSRAPDEQA